MTNEVYNQLMSIMGTHPELKESELFWKNVSIYNGNIDSTIVSKILKVCKTMRLGEQAYEFRLPSDTKPIELSKDKHKPIFIHRDEWNKAVELYKQLTEE